MEKKVLRRQIALLKSAMTESQVEQRSAVLAEKLYATAQYRQAEALYVYIAFNQEVRTQPIIRRAWADGKRVAVPKVAGKRLSFIWLTSFDELAPRGPYTIPEPIADGPVADDPHALVLMPGLAFDPAGHRIGYGGGYYDRFLNAEPDHPTVALCYDFQVYSHLEAESHDVPVDRVIAENDLFK